MKRYAYYLFLLLVLFAMMQISCSFQTVHPAIDTIPLDLLEQIFPEAERYIGMEYEWGGDDFPKGVDCSGLIVNVYTMVLRGSDYVLLFNDTTARRMYENYTIETEDPLRGDLIFMGDSVVDHVAILDRIEDDKVYFIDSSSALGYVDKRLYLRGSSRILSFGRMMVKARH